MNSEYKKTLLCALNRQKNNPNSTSEEPYAQFLSMNGLTKVKPISLTELLSSGGQKKPVSSKKNSSTSSKVVAST